MRPTGCRQSSSSLAQLIRYRYRVLATRKRSQLLSKLMPRPTAATPRSVFFVVSCVWSGNWLKQESYIRKVTKAKKPTDSIVVACEENLVCETSGSKGT